MTYDFYSHLDSRVDSLAQEWLPEGFIGFASGFVDLCTVASARGNRDKSVQGRNKSKDGARDIYVLRTLQHMRKLRGHLPGWFTDLFDVEPLALHPGWLTIDVSFTLQTPWYSKDDRPFHVLHNPVRKERLFGIPFMSAASWKGLLRWSMQMTQGLIGPEPIEDRQTREVAAATVHHLFGNEKGEDELFQAGALRCYPTWFSAIDFEVINPHSRKTRAGTNPIYYEVVPANTNGRLRLLYAPFPRQAEHDGVDPIFALTTLFHAIERLLTRYGFSAKRTAGWGLAEVNGWKVSGHGGTECGTREQVTSALKQLLRGRRDAR
ncbi:MAG: hypothetical protein H0Z37_03350 [Firmicutes bacterium]|nr:hypothetical protein [Bacillota bacterium]